MVPSPEQHNEPKAPDKNDIQKTKLTDLQKHEARFKNIPKSNSTDSQEKKVSALDDGQLRDLLEEAVSYKCPKDRLGKSPLFMELLQRAEADERNQRATNASGSQVVRHYNTAYSQRNRNKHSKETSAAERNSHGGSLQNLYQVNDHTTNRKARKKSSSVSARQREGGSLPSCNIVPLDKIDKITFEKPSKMETSHVQAAHALSTKKSEYTAIDIYNAEPEETQSLIANDVLNNYHENDVEMKDLSIENDTSINELDVIQTQISRNNNIHYTTRASLEILDSRKSNNSLVDNIKDYSSAYKEIDQRKITNGFETTPIQLSSNYNAVKSVMTDGQTDISSIPFSRTKSTKDLIVNQSSSVLNMSQRLFLDNSKIPMFGGVKDTIDKKTFDENGNAVNISSNNEARKKKKTQPKTDRNVTITKPELFKGFCGDKDVDSLVKFIEATNNDKHPNKNNKHVVNNINTKTHKNVTNFSKENENERSSKKRSTERRTKDKSEKLKKSNSLEEISKTKLEDLTSEKNDTSNVSLRQTKKQATFDDEVFIDHKGDRHSWGTEEGQQYYCNDNTASSDGDKKRRDSSKSEKSVKPDVINTNTPDIMSIDSIGSTEASDFQIVTKKTKKSKKRRSTSGGRGNLFNEEGRRNNYYQRDNKNKFQAHDHCDSDMIYLNNFQNTSPDHRRKSTCSMPPSDKSNDSSDLDSVHSLPVESTSMKMCLQQVSTSSGGTPQASYADIAKMANVHTSSTYSTNYSIVDIKNAEKWPTVSNNNNNKTPPSSGGKIQPNVMSVKNYNFPDLIIDNCSNDTCNYFSLDNKIFQTVTEIEEKHLSEAKHNFIKLKNGKTDVSSTNCRILQDQYPALEKTIKTDVKNKKNNSQNSDKNNINNKTKLNKNNNSYSEVPTANKGCDIDKKLSNATNAINATSQELILPNSNNKQQQNNNPTTPSHKKRKSHSGTTNSNTNHRPAVIILNDTENNSSGITFGFDINEKLLLGDTDSNVVMNGDCDGGFDVDNNEVIVPTSAAVSSVSSASCNSIVTVVEREQLSSTSSSSSSQSTTTCCSTEDFTARFVAPTKLEDTINYNHDKIVTFVGLAWEDIVNQQNGGKVQYYSGQ
ncbi:probable serine/threonine-protein kinase DDB_G0282963 isoform X1 [Chrysoperla carnea]|uniref:probable serine/threonine-protein kinase DDB_G0282963 isoform X1 n=2 Tax=Chrysoperla carnea TaxID=189513 RepID=UPI001D08629C|nr:probable serine/threonine-protein kinase DDB_G0282963 isoform X1 [Chrysoperla carnea]